MDPDLIRLILVILGVLLVIGIYLWDRYKRAAPPARMVRQAPTTAPQDQDEPVEQRREPVVESESESIPQMSPADERVAAPDAEPQASRVPDLDPDPLEIGDWKQPSAQADPQFAMDLNFDAHGDNDYLHTDPALLDEVERKIVVVNVVAKKADFSGVAIIQACAAAQLIHGDMAIYHRHDPHSGKVLFSMASMVEPGSFPIDEMRTFSTPGLSLFTQLPGARDGVEIFDAMLSAARQLAAALNGEVQDERRNKMTGQMDKHVRESIIEHRRRLKLARSRH